MKPRTEMKIPLKRRKTATTNMYKDIKTQNKLKIILKIEKALIKHHIKQSLFQRHGLSRKNTDIPYISNKKKYTHNFW